MPHMRGVVLAILGLHLLVVSHVLPMAEGADASEACMLNLLRRSGVGHVKAKQYGKMFLSEEIDETILASLDFGHTNTFLRASGVRSGLDRHKIYSCFSTKSHRRGRCNTSPCVNSVCSFKSSEKKYGCKCRPGFRKASTTSCKRYYPCKELLPCKNGARCKSIGDSYKCFCKPGYHGSRCEKEIDECQSSPCQHGGTCQDLVNKYVCKCSLGYEGTNCETQWLHKHHLTGLHKKVGSLQATVKDLSDVKKRLEAKLADISFGVSYVRWGRTDCRSPATLVYSGSAAGQHYTHKGGAGNPLCLPNAPIYDRYAGSSQNYIYGAEYEINANQPYKISKYHNKDVPCAVCLAKKKSDTIMVPARNVCPHGWSLEYKGYLMSGHYSHAGRQEYQCVDNNPTIIPGRDKHTDGYLLYTVGVACGYGLPCGPFVSGRELTCAICSR